MKQSPRFWKTWMSMMLIVCTMACDATDVLPIEDSGSENGGEGVFRADMPAPFLYYTNGIYHITDTDPYLSGSGFFGTAGTVSHPLWASRCPAKSGQAVLVMQ